MKFIWEVTGRSLIPHSQPVAVLAQFRDHIVLGLVADPVRRKMIFMKGAVETDGGDVVVADEGTDAGALLRHGEARQRPLRPGVGSRHPYTRQCRPLGDSEPTSLED